MEIIINKKDEESPYIVSGEILHTRTNKNELLTGGPPVGTVYWVAPSLANWSDSANWSLTSGGSGGASVPGIDSTAFFDSSGTGACTLDTVPQVAVLNLAGYYGTFFGDCTVTSLNLISGYASAGDSDTTVHVLGDVSGSFTYGAWNPNNNLPISFDGTTAQRLIGDSGCIFPSIVINKG